MLKNCCPVGLWGVSFMYFSYGMLPNGRCPVGVWGRTFGGRIGVFLGENRYFLEGKHLCFLE